MLISYTADAFSRIFVSVQAEEIVEPEVVAHLQPTMLSIVDCVQGGGV